MTEDRLTPEPSRQEILRQLERLAGSSLFRNSKRYPSLLRFIVDETLAGRGYALKERTLGISVFGRDVDYDTNADPVVRISAGEVRKRIAQYYQSSGHEQELRIEIPLGSYQPRFFRPQDDGRDSTNSQKLTLGPDLAAPGQANEDRDEPVQDASPQELAVSVPMRQLPEAPVLPTPHSLAPVSVPEAAPPATPRRGARLHLLALYSLLTPALIALGIFGVQTYRKSHLPPGAALFWAGVLDSPQPTLIVLGIHSFDEQGNDISYRSHVSLPQTQQTLLSAMTRSDMVHLSDLTSYTQITTVLTEHRHLFHTQGAADTTLAQLRQGPAILVGGFNNLWTTNLDRELRFRFVTLAGGHNVIQDSLHPQRTWTLDTQQNALSTTRDYGMVSCYFDRETNQFVVIAAGIGKSGTEAATDFLTDPQGLNSWLKTSRTHTGDNVQVIVTTDVIEGKPGSPQVVDSVRW